MRTTLVIPDAIYRRAKDAAAQQGTTLSEFFTESVEIQLARRSESPKKKRTYKLQPVAMGTPRADPNDREALYRAMED